MGLSAVRSLRALACIFTAVSAQASTYGSPPYRDASLLLDARVEDLLSRMTIEEKAGQLFHLGISMGPNGTLAPASEDGNSTEFMVGEQHISYFNYIGIVDDPRLTATWYNRLQQRALETRLGIPITIATDPRHTVSTDILTSYWHGAFSAWPDSLGLAALRDPALVEAFGNALRQEYLAVGFKAALHPQIDLATEYRWGRTGNTFGEDANLTAQMVAAYLKGFQGEVLGSESVSTVTKHFPGAGPMENGEDSHFVYGKNQTYPGHNFDYHLIPFKAAIAAGARQMMPYYSCPIGTKYDPIGFAFNKGIITELLREELGFKGIVVSDWGLITDSVIAGQSLPARAWGVEYLSELERVKMVLDAGTDQFGGESRPELVAELVQKGELPEDRIDVSVRRLLKEKFELGLFENPFVDVDQAEKIVGRADFVELGEKTQRDSFTLLTNKDNFLPLKTSANTKVYIEGFNVTELEGRGLQAVQTPEEADFALLRYSAPYQPREGGFESRYRTGSLEFNATERARQKAIYDAVPSIVDVYLDRAAAIPEVAEFAVALLGSYGSSTQAFLDVILNVDGAKPLGKLPWDLPRSTAAVEESFEDLPFDTMDPVFEFGHGLSYGQ